MGAVQILLVEDDAAECEMIRKQLEDVGGFRCEVATSLAEAKAALKVCCFDAALLDLSLPDSDGLTTVATFLEFAGVIPVIALTIRQDDRTTLSAVRLGAQDCLVKADLTGDLLCRVVRHAIQRVEVLAELQRYRTELEDMVRERTSRLHEKNQQLERQVEERRSAEVGLTRLATAISAASDGVLVTSAEGHVEYCNDAFEQITGIQCKEINGAPVSSLDLDSLGERFFEEVFLPLHSGDRWEEVIDLKTRGGETYVAHLVVTPVCSGNGPPTGYVCVLRDVTELKRLQQERQQSQRLESVGQMAGGIAHDFNNVMQVITSLTTTAASQIDRPDDLRASLHQIDEAALRAVSLTRKLLAFGRKQELARTPLSIQEVVDGMREMLSRLLGAQIEIETTLRAEHKVHADAVQLEQILMNLCINARDAMPEGGTIYIKSLTQQLDDAHCAAYTWTEPGNFVVLEISDTGNGMPREVVDRIFEPFFSTKPTSEGTGLGLSTVYGIVKQHDGFMRCYSEPGLGTTFRIYLPAIESHRGDEPFRLNPELSGSERLLVVDDDRQVREFTRKALQEAGYTVLVATDGNEALELIANAANELNLVITDLIMPKCSGAQILSLIRAKYQQIRTLLVTGCGAELLPGDLVGDGACVLNKPYTREELLTATRKVLTAS